MTRCKLHPSVQGAGVCSSCLHDRLLALLAAQNGHLSPDIRWNPPRPILLPRSASDSRHRSADFDVKSDVTDDRRSNRRFFHTPQVAQRRCGEKSVGCRRFPLLSSLFRHRKSDESSSSWFASLIRRDRGRNRKKKNSEKVSSPKRKFRTYRISDRGMSPVRSEVETVADVSDCGYSTESSATWQKAAPLRRRHHDRGFGGFSLCISPLVRAGPTGRRSQPSEVGFSGEPRSFGNRSVAGGEWSFGPNRSRKLADTGRFR